jgi:hypothetical protein
MKAYLSMGFLVALLALVLFGGCEQYPCNTGICVVPCTSGETCASVAGKACPGTCRCVPRGVGTACNPPTT